MSKIIIANWKMHPKTLTEAEELYHFSCDACSAGDGESKVIICPPFVYLDALSKISSSTELGAQNCHWEDGGAYTGEVSPTMLKNLGVQYVIVGHSERRWQMNETDEIINKKVKAVLRNGMTPILAVGERKKGDDREQVLADQLSRGLDGIGPEDVKKIIIAYEPVWSISRPDAEIAGALSQTVSQGPDTPDHTLEALKIIKQFLSSKFQVPSSKLLYGGSVDSSNIADFISKPEIDGVLVGGASVKKDEFKKIIETASNF